MHNCTGQYWHQIFQIGRANSNDYTAGSRLDSPRCEMDEFICQYHLWSSVIKAVKPYSDLPFDVHFDDTESQTIY